MGQGPSSYEQPKAHFTQMNSNGNIISITKQNITYSIGDIVSYIDDLGYESVVKIIGISFDLQSQRYTLNLEGDSLYDSVFIDSIKEKKNNGTNLSYHFNVGDKIKIKIGVDGEMTDVIAEVIGIELQKDNDGINKNTSKLNYKLSNGETGSTNWYTQKVHKDTPLTKISAAGKKKYTLEEDSRYRFKYAKYKAKYLIQKNNLHNN